ncbi:MAG: hypothetical protein ACOCYU_06490 [Brevefilum sp.]
MKKKTFFFTEILFLFCFLLFLFASDLAHIEHGAELSLWLMSFAVVLTMAATIFPWLGVRWLRIEPMGSRTFRWLAHFIQFTSWASFTAAMILRWGRNLQPFHWWITLTGILWALWLLVFIYSRYAFSTDDTLNHEESDENTLVKD